MNESTPSQPVGAAQVSGITATELTLMGGVGRDGNALVVVNDTDPSSHYQVTKVDVNDGTNTVSSVVDSASSLSLSDRERIAMLDLSNPASLGRLPPFPFLRC
ncbi:hypothetical protein [Spirochaeta thermophila]|uniref:hypothetical protein n=1 Tax=Winmispira thermophila TaxID=154 RepID=UPI0005A15D17|nr:hypothetical protein [Spirochaeta thermophila]